jgi:hypothetical protein
MISVESSKISSQPQQTTQTSQQQTSPQHLSTTNKHRSKLFLFDALAAGLTDQKTQSNENMKKINSSTNINKNSTMLIKTSSKSIPKNDNKHNHSKNSNKKIIIDMNNVTADEYIDLDSTVLSNSNNHNNSNKSFNVLNTSRSIKNMNTSGINLIDSTFNHSDNNFNLFKNDLEDIGSIFASSSVGPSLNANEKRKYNLNKDQMPILIVSNGVKQKNYHIQNNLNTSGGSNKLNQSLIDNSNSKIKFRLKHYEYKNNLDQMVPDTNEKKTSNKDINLDKTVTSAKIINNSLIDKIKLKAVHLKSSNAANNKVCEKKRQQNFPSIFSFFFSTNTSFFT